MYKTHCNIISYYIRPTLHPLAGRGALRPGGPDKRNISKLLLTISQRNILRIVTISPDFTARRPDKCEMFKPTSTLHPPAGRGALRPVLVWFVCILLDRFAIRHCVRMTYTYYIYIYIYIPIHVYINIYIMIIITYMMCAPPCRWERCPLARRREKRAAVICIYIYIYIYVYVYI